MFGDIVNDEHNITVLHSNTTVERIGLTDTLNLLVSMQTRHLRIFPGKHLVKRVSIGLDLNMILTLEKAPHLPLPPRT